MKSLHRLFSVLFLASLSATGVVAPFWNTPALAAYNTPVSGAAGGDLSGTYPNPTVAKVNGKAAGSAANVARSNLVPMKLLGRNYQLGSDLGSVVTDYGSTSRLTYTTKGPITRLQLLLRGTRGTTTETAGYNSTIQRATVEYNSTVANFTLDGNSTWTMDPNTAATTSDVLGVNIPANTQFYVRFYQRIAAPPTGPPTATAATGGFLAASTAYYYKVTALDNGIESGPSTEFTGTTGTSTLSMTLAWTANTNASGYKIYRSTATGTETLIAYVPAPATGWTDSNIGVITSTATPPAAQKQVYARYVQSGESSNSIYIGGNGTDQTGATGAITGSNGPNGAASPANFWLLGDDVTSNPVISTGDSITAGVGILQNYQVPLNWFDLCFTTGAQNTANSSMPGGHMSDLVSTTARGRLAAAQYADVVINSMGHNDIFNGVTWTALASQQIQMGQVFVNAGKRYFITTLTPSTTSTNNFLTVAGQTAQNSTNETARQNYNTWVRNGSQVSAGTPVLTGGTPSTAITGYFDMAGPVEVNSSNVITPNGGFWQAPTAAYTGQVLTGTPTVTSLPVSTASYPTAVDGLRTYGGIITSGAANGQTFIVSANTATTLTPYANGTASFTGTGTNFVGLTTAPAAGDTFSLYALPTVDGIHGTVASYATIGASCSTWAGINLTPF